MGLTTPATLKTQRCTLYRVGTRMAMCCANSLGHCGHERSAVIPEGLELSADPQRATNTGHLWADNDAQLKAPLPLLRLPTAELLHPLSRPEDVASGTIRHLWTEQSPIRSARNF